MYNRNGVVRIPTSIVAMGMAITMFLAGSWVYIHYKDKALEGDVTPEFGQKTIQLANDFNTVVSNGGENV